MRPQIEKRLGMIELAIGAITLVAAMGLVVASVYYQSIWPHKSRALLAFAMYPTMTAVAFSIGGLLLWKGWEFRFAMQPVILGYGLLGIAVIIGVLIDVYL